MSTDYKQSKVIDYLFDLLPEEEKVEVDEQIASDEAFKEYFLKEKEKLVKEYYVDNLLLPHDRIEFEKKITNDSLLKNEVNLSRNVNIAIKQVSLINQLEKIHCDNIDRVKTANCFALPIKSEFLIPVNRKGIIRWLVAASVAATLIIGVLQLNKYFVSTPGDRIYNAFYSPFDLTGADYTLNSSVLSEAKLKYSKGEYTNALMLFVKLPVSLDIQIEKQFFTGLSLMEIEDYSEAIEKFRFVTEKHSANEYVPHAYWYLGLCYLKTGEYEKARDALSVIANSDRSNGRRAQKILRKLKKI